MRKILVLLCLIGWTACSPSINPKMKAATDSLAASFQNNSRTVAAPAAYPAMPWAVGQWLVQRSVDEKGNVTVSRLSVVGQEAAGIWVEIDSQDYFHRNVTKLLFSRMPTNPDEASNALVKAVSKTDDQQLPNIMDFTTMGPLGDLQKSMFKSVMRNIVITIDLANLVKEDATVPAGTFAGCAKVSSEASFAGVTQRAVTWFHPDVPLNGGVKGYTLDGKWRMELLDYGTTGGASKM